MESRRFSGFLVEDIRAFQNPEDKNAPIFLGATIVMKRIVVRPGFPTEINPVPFPAIAVSDKKHIADIPKLFRPCPELGPGKNMTPLDSLGNYAVRQEGKENNFVLTLCHYDQRSDSVTVTGKLDFQEHMKDVPWGLDSIGTTAAPIDVGDFLLLPIHGIRTDKVTPLKENPDGLFYTYSLGLAVLKKSFDGTLLSVVGVDKSPLIQPKDFVIENVQMGKQLHPELREAIYLCGYVERTDKNGTKFLDMFVSYSNVKFFSYQFP